MGDHQSSLLHLSLCQEENNIPYGTSCNSKSHLSSEESDGRVYGGLSYLWGLWLGEGSGGEKGGGGGKSHLSLNLSILRMFSVLAETPAPPPLHLSSAHLELQDATSRPAEAEAVAGGADSVGEVSRSQLGGPGGALHLLLIPHKHMHALVCCMFLTNSRQQCITASSILFHSRHKSSKSRGYTPLVTDGVSTEMPHCSGVGPCTPVGAPHSYRWDLWWSLSPSRIFLITFALKMRKVMFWSPCIYLFVCVLLA